MRVRHTLICLVFLSLQDGITSVHTGTEGEDITVTCFFSSSGSRMLFCKEECKKDILIETTSVSAERGRYRIEYKKGNVVVSISQLTRSDSGRYRCVLDRTYIQFEIAVFALLDLSEGTIFNERAGRNITVKCSFNFSGRRKYFCKEECEENILVETHGVTAESGRYSIRYIVGTFSGGDLYVSISQLTESDSGRYRCGLDRRLFPTSYQEFEIIVSDDSTTSKPNRTLPAFSTSVPSASTPTATQTERPPTGGTFPKHTWLYVGLTLAVMIVQLSLAVLIYCRKRSSKSNGPPVETEYISVSETNRVYEDVREDRHSRSAPVEISSVYTLTKYTKQKEVATPDDYSYVTAAGSHYTAEDDMSKLTYAEVKFSDRPAGSSNRALRGDDDKVIYSVPRASSDAGCTEDDPPVYATVT